jgi:hypothetical protein
MSRPALRRSGTTRLPMLPVPPVTSRGAFMVEFLSCHIRGRSLVDIPTIEHEEM